MYTISQNTSSDFDKIITAVLDSLTYLDRSQFVTCIRVIKQDAPFFSDRNRISSILRNTLANALQFLDATKNPVIRINVNVTNKAASLEFEEVSSNGRQDSFNAVFESFFRGADSTTGSGLAFYIVKDTIEKLRGNILVKSAHGLGRGVIIKIPNNLRSFAKE